MISRPTGKFAVVIAALTLIPLTSWAAAPTAAPPTRFNCDRDCLAQHADAYFTALAGHDPSRLPLSKDVKYTDTGGIGIHAVLKERGLEMLMSLRLKVEAGLITEAETVLIPGDSKIVGDQQENLTQPSRLWTRNIPVPERNSRFELLAAADAYFSGGEGLVAASRLLPLDGLRTLGQSAPTEGELGLCFPGIDPQGNPCHNRS